MYRTYIPLAILLLASCGGQELSVAENPRRGGLVIGGEDAGESASSIYQMPTPNELFGLVRDLAGEGRKDLLNPISNADRYIGRRERAVNFGIYSTDLVYASTFKLNVEVARYYITTKKMADELGIASAFSDADFVRLEQNLAAGDSLSVISNTAYLKAYEKLEEEQMGPTLALVLAGGWIESMHLLTNHIGAYGRNTGYDQRIAEQKVTLEHLLAMMAPHAQDTDVATLRDQLIGIRDIYDTMPVQKGQASAHMSHGRLVLGNDQDLELNEKTYITLTTAIAALREEYISSEDQKRS